MAADKREEIRQLLAEASRDFIRASNQWEAGQTTDLEFKEASIELIARLALTLQLLDE